MKFDIKVFALTVTIIGTLPLFILFLWCAINGFGSEIVMLFESIHPTGGLSIIGNMDSSFLSRFPGLLVNTAYAAIDNFIFGFLFASLYNFLTKKLSK